MLTVFVGVLTVFVGSATIKARARMPNDQTNEIQRSAPVVRSLSSRRRKWFGLTIHPSTGFTLIELIVVTGIIAALATIGFPIYRAFISQAKNSRAMSEIRLLETEIYDYQVQFGALPADLAAIDRDTLTDPWGEVYVYNDFRDLGTTPERRFGADPLNDDFDLFSMGEDGVSADLVHVLGVGGPGSDDIVRGSNGAFLGTGAAWAGE